MKFGIREVTDITFKTIVANQQMGAKSYANAGTPVLYIDSAKTSSLENTVATVYAQGGRGNPRLLAWDGDKVVTFKFEESLMSKDALAALTGATATTASNSSKINLHLQEKFTLAASATSTTVTVQLPKGMTASDVINQTADVYLIPISTTSSTNGEIDTPISLSYTSGANLASGQYSASGNVITIAYTTLAAKDYIFDYYVQATSGIQYSVDYNSFGGYYMIEANTLFRGLDGTDYPAQFTIPKGKIKSNFTFTMSPTGDPSTFTFEIDAFIAKAVDTNLGINIPVMFQLNIIDQAFNELS
jgi:hypothetical protein